MRWLKKWSCLILFIGTGLIYFSCVDHWQVYAESVDRLKSWYEELKNGDSSEETPLPGREEDPTGGDGTGTSGEEVPGGGTGEPEQGVTDNETANNRNESSDAPDQENEQNDSLEGGSQEDPLAPKPSGEADEESSSAEGTEGSQETGDAEPKEAEYITVEDDYFSDALFIGDSRTVGMFEYGGLEEITTFYASKGLTVYKMFDSEIVPSPEGKITVEEGLQQNTFSKIYLMIGINEMGTGTVETFLEKYREVVEHLKELQPEAIIYVQAIIKVTSERSAKGDYINNEGIDARNEGISLLADNEKIFYLDVNPLICDESGGMDPSYTFDGVHLKAKYIEIWKDYLKTHAISP